MSFAFLNPWFWLGAFAVAAPIWLHLRRRTETNVVRFSAVRFLEDQPMPRRSPLRLRDILLFALRVLALALLVAAFAWPYDSTVEALVVKESRVYILDNTLSHQANDRFQKKRDRLAAELNGFAGDTQAAVIELTSQPRVVAAFGDDRSEAARAVGALEPSFQRGSYLAAFRLANTLLADSLGDRKKILLLGDNQENQWTENTESPPFLRDVDVEIKGTGGPSTHNLSVAEPQAQRIFLGDNSLVNFTARLTHVGKAKSATVVLRSNDQVIFNRRIELKDQPEDILLQAQWEADPRLWVRGELSVDGPPDTDVLEGDDRVFFSVEPVVEGEVALLAQSQFLRVALSRDVMRGQWATRILDPTRLANEVAANEDAEVLVIESNYLQSTEARKLVWRYLSNGRGVLLLVNKITPTINGALRELGFEPADGGSTTSRRAGRVQYVFFHHPIFRPFLSPDYGNLTEIEVLRHTPLKATQGTPLIFSATGEVLFYQSDLHAGKLYLSTFGFDRKQTTWPVHLTFIPFLDLCLQNARPLDPTPTNFAPGETMSFSLPPDSTTSEVVVRDGDVELGRAFVDRGRARVRMPVAPGLYTLSFDDDPEPAKIVSVNPSPKESRLQTLNEPAILETWRFEDEESSKETTKSVAGLSLSRSAILQQRIWWLLLIAGGVGLLLETFWTAMRKERV